MMRTKQQRIPLETIAKVDQLFPKESYRTDKFRKLNNILDELIYGIKR